MIYLDSASSYPILPEVMESLTKSFRTHYANSSSSHSLGLQEAEVVKNWEVSKVLVAIQFSQHLDRDTIRICLYAYFAILSLLTYSYLGTVMFIFHCCFRLIAGLALSTIQKTVTL